MLCGGGNCKIVKRHFPAICMAIQPESSAEFGRNSVSLARKHCPGADECMFVYVCFVFAA